MTPNLDPLADRETVTIFERSREGRRAFAPPVSDVPETPVAELLPESAIRKQPAELPEIAEPEIVRHYNNLSKKNFDLDTGLYPLGSCTMKYNPKLNENVAALPGFRQLHPLQPEGTAQGALRVLYEMERLLGEITGLPGVSGQPVAGAHGELTGILMARAAHIKHGRVRKKVLIPD